MATLKLCIEGMHAVDDECRIEDALRRERGVLGVVANRQEACAEIEFEDDEVAVEHLVSLVAALGYPTQLGG